MTPDTAITNLLILLCLLITWGLHAWALIGINRGTEYEKVNDERKGIIPGSEAGFWFVRFYSVKYFGEHITKTICGCVKCMATLHSVWGFAIFYLLFAGGDALWWIAYPLYWFSLSGFAHAVNMKVHDLEN